MFWFLSLFVSSKLFYIVNICKYFSVKMVDKTFLMYDCKSLFISICLLVDKIKWWTMSIVSPPCPPQNAKKV